MKIYYLYRQPILRSINGEKLHNLGEWYFDDEFSSYEDAYQQAKINALNNSWKVWKIEEVLVFD